MQMQGLRDSGHAFFWQRFSLNHSKAAYRLSGFADFVLRSSTVGFSPEPFPMAFAKSTGRSSVSAAKEKGRSTTEATVEKVDARPSIVSPATRTPVNGPGGRGFVARPMTVLHPVPHTAIASRIMGIVFFISIGGVMESRVYEAPARFSRGAGVAMVASQVNVSAPKDSQTVCSKCCKEKSRIICVLPLRPAVIRVKALQRQIGSF